MNFVIASCLPQMPDSMCRPSDAVSADLGWGVPDFHPEQHIPMFSLYRIGLMIQCQYFPHI